jgi:hypothetical protein
MNEHQFAEPAIDLFGWQGNVGENAKTDLFRFEPEAHGFTHAAEKSVRTDDKSSSDGFSSRLNDGAFSIN